MSASAVLRDLRVLWRGRKDHGFPWPSYRGFAGGWRMVVFGYPRWAALPLWKQALTIPLRPLRYARRVRNVARVRNLPYTPSRYDDVP